MELLELLNELTVVGQISLGITLSVLLYMVVAPWMSLTHLSKLDDIAHELKRIREILEKREE